MSRFLNEVLKFFSSVEQWFSQSDVHVRELDKIVYYKRCKTTDFENDKTTDFKTDKTACFSIETNRSFCEGEKKNSHLLREETAVSAFAMN